MKITITENDHKILIFLLEGKKPGEIKIENLATKTIYGRIRNLRLEFGVKTTKELVNAYKDWRETEKSA